MVVVYLIYDELGLSLLPSQLLPLLRTQQRRGFCSYVIAFVSLRDFCKPAWRRKLRARFWDSKNQKPYNIVMLPKMSWFLNSLLLRGYLWLSHRRGEKLLLHCRGPLATAIALKVRAWLRLSLRVVYDVRGISPEEWEYSDGYGKRFYAGILKRLAAAERLGLDRADGAIFITENLRRYLLEKYHVSPKRSMVVPCYVDTEHLRQLPESSAVEELRAELKGRCVLIYSGSYAAWQMVAEVFSIYRMIAERRAGVFLLLLSPHQQAFTDIAQKSGIKRSDYRVITGSRTEIMPLYRLADMGFLLRARHPINEVAAPVKFAEYLYMGVPVITSEAVPYCAEVISKHDLGVVVDTEKTRWKEAAAASVVTQLNDHPQLVAMKRRCQDYASKHLAFSGFADRYREFYASLMQSPRKAA